MGLELWIIFIVSALVAALGNLGTLPAVLYLTVIGGVYALIQVVFPRSQ